MWQFHQLSTASTTTLQITPSLILGFLKILLENYAFPLVCPMVTLNSTCSKPIITLFKPVFCYFISDIPECFLHAATHLK